MKPDDSIVFLTDFDGTLGDINPDAKLTKIRPEAKVALEELYTRPNYFLGVISGRGMFDVQRRVGIDNITYSGNHGMEILFPNKTEFHYPITSEMVKNCSKLKTIIENEVCATKVKRSKISYFETFFFQNISVCQCFRGMG